MELKGVIWDWDGTLVDSFPACIKATKEIFSYFGIELNEERYRENFSPNWYEIYERNGLPKEYWDKVDAMWKDFFEYSLVNWRDGAEENLSFLKNLGIKIGVVTASTKKDIEMEVPSLHPERYIDEWIVWDDSEKPKPDPLPLLKMLEKLKVSPYNVIYIGDAPQDIIMGKRLRVITFGVCSFFTSKNKLEELSPNFLFNDLFELLAFWKDLLF
ncbi:MAG TPA: HAD family hydrolase [Dictyoglomaceae bacterium]|nr:HAD family hydrolase [Dictyoglomaceae bacterium]HOL39232.1 HAD family hydrolase [Dictyoglomaceae bacterium]HPP15909.1 HAD family hydrolase [Dictyoglomaceae bacterium]